jgi:methylated-DNA-[protein]-cysteine S-methyltransferase
MTGARPSPAPDEARTRALRHDSPVGVLVVREFRGAITALEWLKPRPTAGGRAVAPGLNSGETSPLLVEAARQLDEYFIRRRRTFDLALAPAGSSFYQDLWQLMREIPFGRTATYGQLAREMGCAAQPVGGACGANPIAILIPCHRVVAATGLGGFSGGLGLESKRFLLCHEGALEPELDLF